MRKDEGKIPNKSQSFEIEGFGFILIAFLPDRSLIGRGYPWYPSRPYRTVRSGGDIFSNPHPDHHHIIDLLLLAFFLPVFKDLVEFGLLSLQGFLVELH